MIHTQLLEISPIFRNISIEEALKLVVLYTHVLLCCFAISAVLYSDLKILTGSLNNSSLRKISERISLALIALWATGLLMVGIDTGLQPDLILSNSKLLLKLTVVSVLTANGVVLHFVSFPILSTGGSQSLLKTSALCVTGALSTSHWLLAVFVGISGPLGRFQTGELLIGYFGYLSVTLLIAVTFIPVLTYTLKRSNPLNHAVKTH